MTMCNKRKIFGIVLWTVLTADISALQLNNLKMVIDQDGGADDAMAIFIAMHYEKYKNGPKIVGLTTTHGNVDEHQTYINTQRVLDVADRRDIPIYRGSSSALILPYESDNFFGYDGLGDAENVSYKPTEAKAKHAVNYLIDLSKEYEGQLIVVAIGALTNIALAIKLDPGFLGRLSHLYIGAGNIYSSVYTDPEFNAQMDTEAYFIVSNNSMVHKVTVVPFAPVLYDLNISAEWRKTVLGSIKTNIMEELNSFEQISVAKSDVWKLLDPLVMAVTIDKSIVQNVTKSDNSIILCGSERGINTNDFTNEANSNMNVVIEVNKEKYQNFLLDVFSSE